MLKDGFYLYTNKAAVKILKQHSNNTQTILKQYSNNT